MPTLRWIHLTDLHLGMKDKGLWPSSSDFMLGDIKKTIAARGPVDVVLFTGDLAFSGKPKEYKSVEKTLTQIWQEFHALGSNPVLLPVPGNHDLLRPRKMTPSFLGFTRIRNNARICGAEKL